MKYVPCHFSTKGYSHFSYSCSLLIISCIEIYFSCHTARSKIEYIWLAGSTSFYDITTFPVVWVKSLVYFQRLRRYTVRQRQRTYVISQQRYKVLSLSPWKTFLFIFYFCLFWSLQNVVSCLVLNFEAWTIISSKKENRILFCILHDESDYQKRNKFYLSFRENWILLDINSRNLILMVI